MHDEQRCVNCHGAIVLRGWTCTACGIFNGAEKEERKTCRTCDAPKPGTVKHEDVQHEGANDQGARAE